MQRAKLIPDNIRPAAMRDFACAYDDYMRAAAAYRAGHYGGKLTVLEAVDATTGSRACLAISTVRRLAGSGLPVTRSAPCLSESIALPRFHPNTLRPSVRRSPPF